MTQSFDPQTPQANPRAGYEKTDISFKWVLISLGILGLAAVMIHLALGGLQVWFEQQWGGRNRTESAWSRAPHRDFNSYPVPALQVAPKQDMAQFSDQEEKELNRYAWIDREKQIVRIPITQAVDLLVKQGRPVWGTNHPPKARQSSLDLLQERALPEKKERE